MYGICFEPYVGPWDGSQPVLFNAYSLDQVEELLKPVSKVFSRIRTYGQGTFVWQGVPKIQDSNMYNIQAASSVGLQVSAGCYQQGADPGADTINVDWTKTEIDYAIDQAVKYKNVDELIIGNECIWGPNSAAQIKTLIEYAKSKRSDAGYSKSDLRVTTCQEWGVLAGVNNKSPNYEKTRKAIKSLLDSCEDKVYANIYPYFDPNIYSNIGDSPSESHFKEVVKTSFDGSLDALKDAFSSAGVNVAVYIGETGWPTHGTQPAQKEQIANKTYAQWYYEAAEAFTGKTAFYFEAYNEPWKGDAAKTNSEAYFGVWYAEGTSSAPNQYTLTGEDQIINT
jgi:exo-beta-1,3-glucanase (GH17 family)